MYSPCAKGGGICSGQLTETAEMFLTGGCGSFASLILLLRPKNPKKEFLQEAFFQ